MNDNKKPKAKYKVKNWSAYNKALRDRYSVEVWLSAEAQAGWNAFSTAKRGHPQVYSDIAIATGVVALLNSIFSNSYPVDNQKKHRFFVVFNLQMASKSLKYIGLNCTTKPMTRTNPQIL